MDVAKILAELRQERDRSRHFIHQGDSDEFVLLEVQPLPARIPGTGKEFEAVRLQRGLLQGPAPVFIHEPVVTSRSASRSLRTSRY